jgi:hypothetical protein
MPPASVEAKAERAQKAVEATKVYATKVMTHATKVEKANESPLVGARPMTSTEWSRRRRAKAAAAQGMRQS